MILKLLPNPGISFKINQMDFINPFQQENSNKGRIDFKIPPSETVQYMNMMFKLQELQLIQQIQGSRSGLFRISQLLLFPTHRKYRIGLIMKNLELKMA